MMETKHKKRKQSLGLIHWLILAASLGVFATVAFPVLVKARTTSCQNACVNNLRQLDGAKGQYMLDHEIVDASGLQIADLLGGPEKYIKTTPVCPAGGTYSLGAAGEKPSCSISGDHVLP